MSEYHLFSDFITGGGSLVRIDAGVGNGKGAASSKDGKGRSFARCYEASIVSRAFEGTSLVSHIKGSTKIEYKVGITEARCEKVKKGMKPTSDYGSRYVYSDRHIDELKKVTPPKLADGLPAEGDTFNYSGLCRRLGQALAFYSAPEAVDADPAFLLGGKTLTVAEVRPRGRTYGSEGLFLQAHGVEAHNDIPVMGVLAYCAASLDTPVYASEVYAENGHWIARLPTGVALLETVMRAAQFVIDSACLSDHGAVCIFQFICGIHDVVSVHGHTDEGGFFRDLLRHVPVEPVRGALAGRPAQSVRLGIPSAGHGRNVGQYANLVDRMAIASAALVAVSDPGVGEHPRTVPVTSVVADAGDGSGHEHALLLTVGEVASEYSRRLCAGTGVNYKASPDVDGLMTAALVDLMGGVSKSRHLRHKTVHPWFWVEPTPVLAGAPDEVGFSRVCPLVAGRRDGPVEMSMWGNCQMDDLSEGVRATMEWRRPRESGWWYLYSPNAHKLDGMSQCKVLRSMGQGKADGPGEVRGCTTSPGVAAAGQAGTLGELVWTLGSSGVPPPAMACPTSTSYVQFEYKMGCFDTWAEGNAVTHRFVRENLTVSNTVTMVQPSTLKKHVENGDREFVGTRGCMQAYALLYLNNVESWVPRER